MKKFIILAAALLVSWQAQAQFVLGGGFMHTLEKVTSTFSDGTYSHKGAMNGIYVGGNYYYNLDQVADGLAFLPGVNFSMLLGRHWAFSDVRVSELALNLPLQLGYTYPISDNVKIFGQTGPTLQIALSHKAKDNQGTTYSLLRKDNKFGESRGRFNLYWGLDAGVEINEQYRIDLGWDLGLLNLNRKREDNTISKISRSYLHVGVAYLF